MQVAISGRDFHSGSPRQFIDQFAGGDRSGIDPVYVRKCVAALVVIDVNQELPFEAFQPGALNVVAFEKDDSVVVAVDAVRLR